MYIEEISRSFVLLQKILPYGEKAAEPPSPPELKSILRANLSFSVPQAKKQMTICRNRGI
jgi:hypothetical protein